MRYALAPAEPYANAAQRTLENIRRSHASGSQPHDEHRSFSGAHVGGLLEDDAPARPLTQALPPQVTRLQHQGQRPGEPRIGFHHVAPPLHAANVNSPSRGVIRTMRENVR